MKTWLLAAAASFSAPFAHAAVIDFGEGTSAPVACTSANTGTGPLVSCTTGNYISQSYGDVAGVLDVTYEAPRIGGGRSLRWWDKNYNNLYGVVWADGGDGNSQARIDLQPLNGQQVTLSSFDLGAYSFGTLATTVSVTDLQSGATLFSFTGSVGNSNVSATTFTPNVSSVNGLRITWQDSAYNVGIDHITFNVTAVPEPGTVALMLAGLTLVGAAARRRRG